jgi:thiamine biosynthesis protein ThiS
MQIRINGEAQEFDESTLSVAALLEKIGVDVRQVAVEKNFEIVPKSQYARVMVVQGDAIELVEFVGGG